MTNSLLLVFLAILIVAALICVEEWVRVHQNYNKKYGLKLEIISTSIFCMSVISYYITVVANEHELRRQDLTCKLAKSQRDVLYDCTLCDECLYRPDVVKTKCSPNDIDKQLLYNHQLQEWFCQNKDSIISCVMKGENALTIVIPFSRVGDVYVNPWASYMQKSIDNYNIVIKNVENLKEKEGILTLLELLFAYIYIPLVFIAFFVCILKWCLEWNK